MPAKTVPSIVTRRLRVTGKVQGVFYRKYTQKAAIERNITGWVRNNLDGSVEILAEGTLDDIESLRLWCFSGSPKSKVLNVAVSDTPSGDGAEASGASMNRVFPSFVIDRS